jgi:hypothetical protein
MAVIDIWHIFFLFFKPDQAYNLCVLGPSWPFLPILQCVRNIKKLKRFPIRKKCNILGRNAQEMEICQLN